LPACRCLALPEDDLASHTRPAQTLLYAHIDAQRTVMAYQFGNAATFAPADSATAALAAGTGDAGAMLFVTAALPGSTNEY